MNLCGRRLIYTTSNFLSEIIVRLCIAHKRFCCCGTVLPLPLLLNTESRFLSHFLNHRLFNVDKECALLFFLLFFSGDSSLWESLRPFEQGFIVWVPSACFDCYWFPAQKFQQGAVFLGFLVRENCNRIPTEFRGQEVVVRFSAAAAVAAALSFGSHGCKY